MEGSSLRLEGGLPLLYSVATSSIEAAMRKREGVHRGQMGNGDVSGYGRKG